MRPLIAYEAGRKKSQQPDIWEGGGTDEDWEGDDLPDKTKAELAAFLNQYDKPDKNIMQDSQPDRFNIPEG